MTEVGETAHEDETIVVFLGRLSVQRRRDLGAVCWRRSRTFLVVDELLALYLLAQTGPRLSVLFRCTIPFTSIEPFTLSGGLVPPEMFFGRQRERESVLTDSGSCFVYGGRQLGKTALLKSAKRTFEKREDERFAVFVDLEAQGLLRDREDIDAVWSIFSRACAEESIPMKSGTSATADSFCDTLSDWMNKDTRRRVLLLVDEADRFLTEDGRQGGFSRTARLKGLMDKTDRRFKVVFSGLHNVQRTTRLANHPLAHLGEPLCIGPLLNNGEVRAARALVEDTLGGLGFRFASPDLVTRILSQTNYYPSLLQLYCHELLRLLTDTNAPGGLDPRTGPPRVISARHVDDAYSRQGLRKAIEDRFSWTLQLDQRYEVIALTIALASLIPEAGERTAIGDGLAVSWIQSEASYWWAKGFEDGVGEDSFGTLLEEMVGLGILRHSGDGRFALRSPNVVSLMGSKQAIEERLQKERVPSAAFDPSLYRRMMVAGNPAQRSPATVSQESALRGGKPGITVVIGTTLAGLDELPALLKMMSREDGGVFRHVTDRVDLKELHAILREEPKGTPPAFVCTYIRMDAIFDPVWIPRSIAVIEKAKQKGRLRKLVLGIDGTSLWSGLCADKDGFPPSDGGGLATVNLRPWNESMVRVWLDDNRFADIDQIVPRLRDVTGFWPVLLFQFIERAGQRPERWQLELNALAGELNKSDRKDGLKQDLSLSVQGPARVLEVFRTMDGSPGSESDILDLEASLEPADVRRAVAWLEHLRLAQRIGGGGLSLDPVVRRVLLED